MLLVERHKVAVVDIIQEKVQLRNEKSSPIVDVEIEKSLANKPLNFAVTLDKEFTDTEFVIISTLTDYDLENNSFTHLLSSR